MRGREVERLCRNHILPELSGFAVSSSLLYRDPVEDLLCAFCFESSAYDRESFFFWVFVQPLYVRKDHVVFTFGNRLGLNWELAKGKERDVASKLLATIREEGLPWLESVRTPAKFAKNVFDLDTMYRPDKAPVLQAVAYSQALTGQYEMASKTLNRLFTNYEGPAPDAPAWAHELFSEIASFRDTLLSSPETAQAQLKKWREQTLKALGLDRKQPRRGHRT
jgi:hypothetical protein